MGATPLTHNPLNGVHGSSVHADARCAARAAGLALCARWADDAEELVRALAI
jgi:hypothetical protein